MKRNQSWTRYGIILIIAALVILSGCRTSPIYNAKDVSISPRASVSEEEMADAIRSAGRRLGWDFVKEGAWELKAMKRIGNHSLTVSIGYSKTAFDILYVDSENLLFDGQNIHDSYNVWVRQLEEMIQTEIKFRVSGSREVE